NLQAIIDSIEREEQNAHISIVISSTRDAMALKRAEKHGIKTIFIDPTAYLNSKEYDKVLIEKL
ncbi:MAG: phosphoribosylglycinamide formyltransferase, partial [Nitrospinales bacterium]|nr:phosphoribosylglycinamide formyltransferase [Nitrospinales bacterium]